jgi:para-nitrobenzyl esterase
MKMKFLLLLFFLINTSILLASEFIVKTNTGIAYGNASNNVINWDDIPYAKPPINELRWKAPRKINISSSNKTL